MKRLYEAYAYGSKPIDNCFWNRSVPLPKLPSLTGSLKVEVAVVDAETPFWGASGRNGGFCCLGGAKASEKTLITRFGEAGKTEFRRCEKAAVNFVADLIARHDIEVNCHSKW